MTPAGGHPDFDAIVVGSGITGGWAAKELTQSGLKVLVLERGRDIDVRRHQSRENAEPWQQPYAGRPSRELCRDEYAVQSTNATFSENTRHLWNNDRDNPYAYSAGTPFHWLRADVVGGRSLLWYGLALRMCEQDFEANRQDGHGIDWPIRYRDLAPWYDHVEDFVGISGEDDGIAILPAGPDYLPPMPMNAVEKHVKAKIESRFPERRLIVGRAAIRTRADDRRGACIHCGPCTAGCPTGAHFNSLNSTLPAARATGLLTLRADSVAERLIYDPHSRRVSGVQVVDAATRARTIYTARMVFLCASAIASTQILLNSACEAAPHGLGNSSGTLGHYLMDHPTFGGAIGLVQGFDDRYYRGYRPNSVYMPRFRNVGRQEDVGFVRGYGLQGHARRLGWRDGAWNNPGFGAAFKDALAKPGPWMMGLRGYSECLPYRDNRIALSRRETDRFGIPLVEFHFSFRDNERRQGEDLVAQAKTMLEAAGATDIRTFEQDSIGGDGIHEMGTACMGRDPQASVLNAFNQSHDVPNLFVTDGACMSSSSCVNPALTFMALTARAAHYAVAQLRAGLI